MVTKNLVAISVGVKIVLPVAEPEEEKSLAAPILLCGWRLS